MDFILNEDEDNTPNLLVSDIETEENIDDSDFVDVTPMEQRQV